MKKVESIKQLIEELKNDKSAFLKYDIGKLTEGEIEQIKQMTGFDLSGYTRTIDSYGINHAMDKHSNAKSEKNRGQTAIEHSDFELIEIIVSNPDSIESVGKNRQGNDLIRYTKVIDFKMYYVEEIRTGRKEVILQTLYKQKKPS